MTFDHSPISPALRDLILRSQVLFPLTSYLDPTAVRAARRRWIRAIQIVRPARPGVR